MWTNDRLKLRQSLAASVPRALTKARRVWPRSAPSMRGVPFIHAGRLGGWTKALSTASDHGRGSAKGRGMALTFQRQIANRLKNSGRIAYPGAARCTADGNQAARLDGPAVLVGETLASMAFKVSNRTGLLK